MQKMEELLKQAEMLAVARRPEACLGCGFEHSCSLHGCAVIKALMEIAESRMNNARKKLLVKNDSHLGYAYFCPACKRFLCNVEESCIFCGQPLDFAAEKELYEGPVIWPTVAEMKQAYRRKPEGRKAMREILFRGKRVDNGEWAEGYLVKHPSAVQVGESSSWCIHVPPMDPDDSGRMCWVDPETIGQYTGIMDKHGEKIFEGDLLVIGNCNKPLPVEFSDFSWECTEKSIYPYYRHRLEDNSKKYEIVGNIHGAQHSN